MRLKLESQSVSSIPGLEKAQSAVFALPLANNRKKLEEALRPRMQRAFYIVTDRDLVYNQDVLEKLAENYRSLDAITIGTSTYILPRFFKKSENEQAAILLRESLRVYSPQLDLRSLALVEQAFREYLELLAERRVYDPHIEVRFAFSESFCSIIAHALSNYPIFCFRLAAMDDLAYGRLNGFLISGNLMPFDVLLPKNSLVEVATEKRSYTFPPGKMHDMRFTISDDAKRYAMNLVQEYPDVLLFKLWDDALENKAAGCPSKKICLQSYLGRHGKFIVRKDVESEKHLDLMARDLPDMLVNSGYIDWFNFAPGLSSDTQDIIPIFKIKRGGTFFDPKDFGEYHGILGFAFE